MNESSALPDRARHVRAAAEELGLAIEIRIMPETTATAEEAARACGCSVAEIVKSLVFRGKLSGKGYLLLVSGANRVNERAIAALIGEAIVKADAEFVRKATGYAIGGVAPFGHPQRLTTLIDAELLSYDRVFAAAGTPNAVFAVAPNRLSRVTLARAVTMK